MINKAVLEKLEFPKVLQFISKYASTEPGKGEILKLEPIPNPHLCAIEGAYVTEAKEILIKNDVPPFQYIPDLNIELSTSRVEGAVLDKKAILDILNLAVTSRKLFQFLKAEHEFPNIGRDFQNKFFVDKVFEHHIEKIIDENGEVRDTASSKLREIREEIRKKGRYARQDNKQDTEGSERFVSCAGRVHNAEGWASCRAG